MIDLSQKSTDGRDFSTEPLSPKSNVFNNFMDSDSNNNSTTGEILMDFSEEDINTESGNDDYLRISIKEHDKQKKEEDKFMKNKLKATDYQRTFHVDNNLKKGSKSNKSQDNILGVHLPKGHRDKKSLLLLK
ncbi:hypothetical protein BX659_106122 [Orenia metallireducens]|jgi:HSP20 family molecular chaperone IbpA|uniref:Uncharacterized protein n=1 Tax=Orenia metallireducens TaxID=1413210 RepID=A0A285GW08_9FIRM|nr:hypothetical protein [Orenia metallireducens]PRX31088.1 hypothetical protein BX659_106122 [Orenia metallireducens]SNY27665.1 hypothetical protein SAMN06265827_11164 [Orenia metallireducens]